MGVIEEIKAGNKEAIKEVYKENVKDVYNFAKSITGNHDTALDATKKTFVILFSDIQKGETPTNIRLAALKIAYDEACKIAMPSTDEINSPYDRKEEPAYTSEDKAAEEQKEEEQAKTDYAERQAAERTQPELSAGPETGYQDEIRPAETDADESSEDEAETYEEYFFEKKRTDLSSQTDPESEKTGLSEINMYEDDEEEPDFDEANEKSAKKHWALPALSIIFLIVNIILVLILIWFLLGLFQNLGIIPESVNLGHEWFNDAIYPLF